MPRDKEHMGQLVDVMMDAMDRDGSERDADVARDYVVAINNALTAQHKQVYKETTDDLNS